jgi:hypothetical protein
MQKELEAKVYPSNENTITCEDDPVYGGAHKYLIRNCLGFVDGQTKYVTDSAHILQFIQKNDDGSIIPGLQSEQLVLMLIDRQKKLNARFPSPFSDKAVKGLEMFLEAQKERVEERINRGVMGELKK